MLINFSVSNFLSFNERQTFSMIGGKVQKKPEHLQKDKNLKLLKFAAVFGANASGKSNLVSAMQFAQELILNTFPHGTEQDYCRIHPENKTKPSSFEFEIKIGKHYYAYGFDITINQRSIAGEWLYELPPKQPEKLIFEREPGKGSIRISPEYNTTELHTVATFLKTNTAKLFLQEMNENKGDLYTTHPEISILRDVYHWFSEHLSINYPDYPLWRPTSVVNKNNLKQLNNIITSLGLGIDTIDIVPATMEEISQYFGNNLMETGKILDDLTDSIQTAGQNEEPNPETGVIIQTPRAFYILRMGEDTTTPKAEKLCFRHLGNNTLFEFNEESDGTRRMIDLIGLIFDAESGNSRTYVIDEIDRNLHPQLTYKLIETYLSLVNRGNIQLIVTTHESHIMDLQLLRRDEIWFVEKNQSGESKLYSLENFTERFDKKVSKAYLEGRYGSTPLFDAFYPMHPPENT